MTGFEIVGAIGAMSALICVFQNENNKSDEVHNKALLALNRAVSRTEGSISRSLMNQDSEKAKHELTELWYEASIALENANYPKMARLAQIKGVFWLDPSSWTDDDIRQSGIELSKMRKKLDDVVA